MVWYLIYIIVKMLFIFLVVFHIIIIKYFCLSLYLKHG